MSTLQSNEFEPIPSVSFDEFMSRFLWIQGEHIGMIGPTGQGKTNLSMHLLPARQFVTVIATKPKDETLDIFIKGFHYKKFTDWKSSYTSDRMVQKYPKRILWPDASSLKQSRVKQTTVFDPALSDLFGMGSWCVCIDELWWMSYILKFQEEIKIYLQQGRSLDLSLMCATQRPAWVPLELYDMSTHLFFWADNDRANLNRISGIGSFNSDAIRLRIRTLRQFEVLYVNTRDHYMCTFIPPLLVLKVR